MVRAILPFLLLLPAFARAEPRALVVVIDGAGDLKGCSNAVTNAVAVRDCPVVVRAFPWSHGYRQILKDQTDERHSRDKGRELAKQLLYWQKEQPGRPIVLISYSAGCAVALAACPLLPDAFLERNIMFAPSVSTRYDPRDALRVSRDGCDVFCSGRDRFALGIAMRLVGTADGIEGYQAAGRYGFRPTLAADENAKTFGNLRHHFWSKDDGKLGHDGRHHGVHAVDWLKERVLPLLAPGE